MPLRQTGRLLPAGFRGYGSLDERIDTGTTVRELAGIARSFNGMLDRLHRVFESQKRLVADASHKLKTPLAVIRTQCDVTLQKERSPAEYGEALSTIRSETRSITRLVNDLLSLAKLDAGLVVAKGFAPVRVRDLADHAVRLTASLAFRQEVRVTVAIGDTLGSRNRVLSRMPRRLAGPRRTGQNYRTVILSGCCPGTATA